MARYCKQSCEEFQHIPKMIGHKYVDHNYCSECVAWFLKTEFNIFCPCCGMRLRHRGKYAGARKKEVLV